MRRLVLVSMLAGCPGAGDDGTSPPVTGDSDASAAARDVGRIGLRRLTRAEVVRTVRDLLGIESPIGADLPADDPTDGFDVVAEGLTVSPLLVELMERGASALVDRVLDRALTAPIDLVLQAEDAFTTDAAYQGVQDGALALYSAGTVDGTVVVPESGRYRLSARVWGDQAGPDALAVSLGLLAETGTTFQVTADAADGAQDLVVELDLQEGAWVVELAWSNDYYDAEAGADRNLYVDRFRLEGPLDFVPTPNPAWDRVMSCDPDEAADAPAARACAASILDAFAPRAWRRPLDGAERDALLGAYDAAAAAGDGPREALGVALRIVLASPHFLFLTAPPPPDGSVGPVPVDPYALASRLSYALWSSAPDDALLAAAADGTLATKQGVAAQTRRMLDDPRAGALAEELAGQWLQIRALADARPDGLAYLGFDEELRASMRASMVKQFEDLVFEDRPATDLLLSTEAWLDRRLSLHYGLPNGAVPDGEWRRLDVGPYGRRGWLTTAGLLTATSYPTRTSPVRRGVWVLSEILCDPPDPPPAGVGAFPEPSETATTIRERLEAHRKNPACAGCHDAIDPVGLAFEHFDGIGRYRDFDGTEPIDATGTLPDGTAFDGVDQLARVLADDPRFPACVVRKLFTWTHARAPRDADAAFLADAQRAFREGGGTLEALLVALTTSDTFRLQEAP